MTLRFTVLDEIETESQSSYGDEVAVTSRPRYSRCMSRFRCGVTLAMVLSGPTDSASQVPATDTPEHLYQGACAACHGSDGRGAPQSSVAFDVPLPDFTDCAFASREPDADWLAVAHEGGSVRGFDSMMPAFGEALSLDELQRSLDHVRGFCTDTAWPRGELNLPRPLVTEKAYPEDEAVLTTIVDAEGAGAVTNTLVYEKRFGARNQIEIAVPLAARAGALGDWSGGVGDIAVGVKRAVLYSLRRGSIFSLNGEVAFPTGDERNGLGKGTAVVEPFVTFGQLLPADAFLHMQGGVELPTDTDRAEQEAFWRFAVGKSFAQSAFGRSWSPMLEVLAARKLADDKSVQWDLLPQVQVTLNQRQHVIANVGVRIPVTDRGHRSRQVLVYLLWDWYDGGFFEGW